MNRREQKITGREDYRENYYGRIYPRRPCKNGPGGCIYSNTDSYGTDYKAICPNWFSHPPGPLRAEYFKQPKKSHHHPIEEPECGFYSNLTSYGCAFGPNYSCDSRYAKKCCKRVATCPFVGVV